MFSTSSTFTSLYRFASMRRAWSRSASTVIVMRDTSGFSVRPTVSESILKARRRNSEATRVRTPGLFSTYTMNVFSIIFIETLNHLVIETLKTNDSMSQRFNDQMYLLVIRRLDNRAGPPNHIVQRRAGRDHRIDRIFLFDLEIDQHRPIMLARRFDSRHDLRTLRDGRALDPISVR